VETGGSPHASSGIDKVREIVQSVPPEWGISAAQKEEWAKAICRRAKRIIGPLQLALCGTKTLV